MEQNAETVFEDELVAESVTLEALQNTKQTLLRGLENKVDPFVLETLSDSSKLLVADVLVLYEQVDYNVFKDL